MLVAQIGGADGIDLMPSKEGNIFVGRVVFC